jgi:hypothetical protein
VALYWISYDLDRPGRDYSKLLNRLKDFDAVNVLVSDWILRNDTISPAALRDDLARFLEAEDRIIVVEVHDRAAWRNLLAPDKVVSKTFTHAM